MSHTFQWLSIKAKQNYSSFHFQLLYVHVYVLVLIWNKNCIYSEILLSGECIWIFDERAGWIVPVEAWWRLSHFLEQTIHMRVLHTDIYMNKTSVISLLVRFVRCVMLCCVPLRRYILYVCICSFLLRESLTRLPQNWITLLNCCWLYVELWRAREIYNLRWRWGKNSGIRYTKRTPPRKQNRRQFHAIIIS